MERLSRAVEQDVVALLLEQEERYAHRVGDCGTQDDLSVAFVEGIERRLHELATRFGGLDSFAQKVASAAVRHTVDQTAETLRATVNKAFGVDITTLLKAQDLRGPVLLGTLENVRLIKSIPAQYLERVQAAVLSGVGSSRRATDIAKDLRQIAGVTESRAKFIARDQTAKLNAQITEARQTQLGVEEYIWSTSGDSRVRDTHEGNDGQTFRWDSPPPTGHPGHDPNCRCVAIPVIKFT